MILAKVGERIRIQAGEETNDYIVRGVDVQSNSIWLAIDDPLYEGYSGDGIYTWDGTQWHLRLTDARSSLPKHIG